LKESRAIFALAAAISLLLIFKDFYYRDILYFRIVDNRVRAVDQLILAELLQRHWTDKRIKAAYLIIA
jgi:hypothetical protein